MKIRLHHILVILTITFAGSVASASAQEAAMEELEISDPEKDRAERDRIISSPGEGDTRYVTRLATDPATKDSAQATTTSQQAPVVQTAKAKVEKAPAATSPKPVIEKQEKNQDDSILSFNFLYYIIEKYKLQDIVD